MSGKVVFCDFAGVLTEPVAHTFARLARRTGIDGKTMARALDEVAAEAGLKGLEPLALGLWTENEWAARLGASLAAKTGAEIDLSDFGARWWFPGRRRGERFIGYLGELHGQGVRMALLTNNVREWEPLWKALVPEYCQLFAAVVDSCRVGFCKPAREMFELAAGRMGATAGDCMLIDDGVANCVGARAAGWNAIPFTDADSVNTRLSEWLGLPTPVELSAAGLGDLMPESDGIPP